jgi:hypothetical protein
MLPLSIRQLWRGSAEGVWAQASLGGMGCLVQAGYLRFSMRAGMWAVSSFYYLQGARIWAFWKFVSFCPLTVSPRRWNVLFHQTAAVMSCPYWVRSSGGKIVPPFIWPQVLFRGGAICPPDELDCVALQNSWYVTFTRKGCSLTQLWDGRVRWHKQVLCSRILPGPGKPRCLQDLTCSSLCCDFAFLSSKTGEKKSQRKERAGRSETASQKAEHPGRPPSTWSSLGIKLI